VAFPPEGQGGDIARVCGQDNEQSEGPDAEEARNSGLCRARPGVLGRLSASRELCLSFQGFINTGKQT